MSFVTSGKCGNKGRNIFLKDSVSSTTSPWALCRKITITKKTKLNSYLWSNQYGLINLYNIFAPITNLEKQAQLLFTTPIYRAHSNQRHPILQDRM